MVILGLTGSIGMGKSRAGRVFRQLGVPVFDADRMVHGLTEKGGEAVGAVAQLFPGVVRDGAVDRAALGAQVFGNPNELRKLEGILHPRVRIARASFLRLAQSRREAMVLLDIPLLFETGAEDLCDAVIVVSAPGTVQASRVLSRPGMTPEKFRAILSAQVSDDEKRQRADFVVQTGHDKGATLRRLTAVVTLLRRGGWRTRRAGERRQPPYWKRDA